MRSQPSGLGDAEDPVVGDEKRPSSRARRLLESRWLALTFGIVGPIACFGLRPVIIPEFIDLPGLHFIDAFWIFGYGVIGLEVFVLILWLVKGDRLGGGSGLVSGVMLGGGLFAGGLGLVLLPFSLIGLLVGVGMLGLVPFATSAVFLANARLAFARARAGLGGPRARGAMLLGLTLALGVPGAIQGRVSLAARSAIRGVAQGDPAAMGRLRAWCPYIHRDQLLWTYAAEPDPEKKGRLALAYKELSGEDAEDRLRRLAD